MTFEDVVRVCFDNPEFVAQFDRLHGANLSLRGSPLDLQIDIATGGLSADVQAFVEFVHETVWTRLPGVQTEG